MGFYQKLQKNTPDEPELQAWGVAVASFTKQLLHTCLAESSPASQLHPLSGNQLCASGMSIKALSAQSVGFEHFGGISVLVCNSCFYTYLWWFFGSHFWVFREQKL